MLLNVSAKLMLICLLMICILAAGFSGFGLYFGVFSSPAVFYVHIIAGMIFLLLAVIHLLHRRKKLLKLITQFSDAVFYNKYPSFCNLDRLLLTFEHVTVKDLARSLQLPLGRLTEEFTQGHISVADPNKTLREIVKDNDEKLFSAITIAMQLRFNPAYKITLTKEH